VLDASIGWLDWLVCRGRFRGRGRLASDPPFGEGKKTNKLEKEFECLDRNKGKHSELVPHCNFYLVTLPIFLLKTFSIRFQFSDYNIL